MAIYVSQAEAIFQFHQIFKGVGMELALASSSFMQLRIAAHRGFFPFPVS